MRATARLILGLCLLTAILLVISGCSTVSYYTQAVAGQTSILLNRRDLAIVIADDATSTAVREKLTLVQSLRAFAESELSLPVGRAYGSYVETGRPFVVWNVFAAPEFSLTMKSFCYPVAGCVSYRGYFAEADAEQFAATLREEGYDVFVGGVAAYSTLGWFADPVLDTFLSRSERDLAGLIFHELAHRVVYVKGDTRFNESFATAVQQVGVSRWLERQSIALDLARYGEQRQRRLQVLSLIDQTKRSLTELYESEMPVVDKRQAKTTQIAKMRADYAELRESWAGHRDFSAWMASDINNARLGILGDYNTWVPAFHQLLSDNDGDLARFFDAVETMAAMTPSARQASIEKLMIEAGH